MLPIIPARTAAHGGRERDPRGGSPSPRRNPTRALIASLIAALLAVASGPVASAETGYGKQKVVYHINYDDPKKQKGALRNIQNHINAVGAENMDLRVVMHGNGLTLLMRANEDPNFESGVANLKSRGIGFKVCANTLKGRRSATKTTSAMSTRKTSCRAASPRSPTSRPTDSAT